MDQEKLYKPVASIFIPARNTGKTAFIDNKYKDSDSTKIKKIRLSSLYGSMNGKEIK